MEKTGFLLINLGSPDSYSTKDVRRYLGEFLMDPYVINLPWLARKMIVSGFILPFRPKSTSEAYKKIWMDTGSPLLFFSQNLGRKLEEQFGIKVEVAMRYGRPSISEALSSFERRNVQNIKVLPLYPQFCDATVTTTINKVVEENQEKANLSVIPPFYSNEAFVKSSAKVIAENLPEQFDHLLFSYHSLPESQIKNSDPSGKHCLSSPDCCLLGTSTNGNCYRHQCIKTSDLISLALNISKTKYSTSFQSKLGPVPWLTPSTEKTLISLAKSGVKQLVVACPSFVADNLETLEEIGDRGQETFIKAGGHNLTLVPCLNDRADWIDGLGELLIGHSSDEAIEVTSA